MASKRSEHTLVPTNGRGWPFGPQDTTPLAWWRTVPSYAFRDAEHVLLLATLKRMSVLHGGSDFASAQEGEAAAAIGVAFSLMPITEMTLKVDIAMTALLRCALERNAAAALVLTQVLSLTNLGHGLATDLAASWFAHGLRHSTDPEKFSKAETTLLATSRGRNRKGNIA
ncbi:hypothetical protein AS156_18205 [Bradyrhizobium macuxiense]|uniref:Uncharacterized protein n=1 Tax=Bradyrhizobium macuxiense TaxID=1755647 RepID=A0A109JGI6_9BRAD|nr:hypothetical protein [Bradyrhizobium macuxiense]KWV48414.1 hypothetical protein AS156_18205 [Bradyrhizobium macuxiense]